ncbi:MAG: TetR/AcrR family transcriptional regulator C-terminal domain-containing protein [Smithellaceae bacterium]
MDEESISIGAKYIFALSLKDLVKTKSLDKISVQEIVHHCGAGRQTFYNHFNNKDALVNWIYESNVHRIRNKYWGVERWDKGINMILSHVKKNRLFYTNAFSYEGKDYFINSLYKNSYDSYMTFIRKRFGKDQVTDSLIFAVQFYSYGSVNMARQWSDKGMSEDPDVIAKKMYLTMPSELMKFVSYRL